MGSLGPFELILIFLAVLLIFGAKRIPEIARGLGKGIREFKSATSEISKEFNLDDASKKIQAPRQHDYGTSAPRTDAVYQAPVVPPAQAPAPPAQAPAPPAQAPAPPAQAPAPPAQAPAPPAQAPAPPAQGTPAPAPPPTAQESDPDSDPYRNPA